MSRRCPSVAPPRPAPSVVGKPLAEPAACRIGTPVEVAVHEGELYRHEDQIYPVAGDKYYELVSGFTMRFHRHNGNVDSIVTIFADGSEQVLRKVAAP